MTLTLRIRKSRLWAVESLAPLSHSQVIESGLYAKPLPLIVTPHHLLIEILAKSNGGQVSVRKSCI